MTALDPRLVRVESIGTRTFNAFWSGHDDAGKPVGGFGPVTQPAYPPSPRGERLAAERKRGMVGLMRAAAALGLTAENLSGVERGRYVFVDEQDWDRAEAALFEAIGKLALGEGEEDRS